MEEKYMEEGNMEEGWWNMKHIVQSRDGYWEAWRDGDIIGTYYTREEAEDA